MRALILALLIRILFPAAFAHGKECSMDSAPAILVEAPHELHQVWTMDDSPIYWSQKTSDDSAFSAFKSEIRKRMPDLNPYSILQREYQDFMQSGDPNYIAETNQFKLVLAKQAGSVRPINCLESLLLTTQIKRQPMIELPSEFSAFILKNADKAHPRLKIYFSTFDSPGGKIAPTVTDLIEQDLTKGWTLWRHLHNHNFFFQDSISVMGGSCPGRSDLQLYLSLAKGYGLQSAAVTNGFDTIELTAADFTKLISK